MSTETHHFKLDIFTEEKADVYLSCANWDTTASRLVKRFDEASLRVVGDVSGLQHDEERVRRIMSGCSGLVALLPGRSSACTTDPSLLGDLRIGAELGIPLAVFGSSEPFTTAAGRIYGPVTYDQPLDILPDEIINAFVADILKSRNEIRPYAFYIGRLERDFTQAREAIRVAVENEAGIPFLWADDGRHRTNVESVRERTRLLLQHASFVVADLTLGVESPERENPSRAHEIGMSIAYDRKLLLLSQEPRRYPYFSIGDLQMLFWSTEADLECKVTEWVHNHRDSLGRTIWNHRLAEAGYEPKIVAPTFRFNPNERYLGPKTPVASGFRRRRTAVVVSAAAFLVITLITLVLVIARATK